MPPAIYLGFGGAGVYRSTDGGHTFAAANNGIPGSFPYGNVFVSSNRTLFVGTNAGIYKSADGGSNWTPASSGLPSQKTIRALEVSGNTLYTGTSGLPVALGVPDNGIFKSTDDGVSWQATNFKNRTDFSINSLLASGSRLYAATSAGLYVSTDGFATWTPVDKGRVQTNVSAVLALGSSVIAAMTDGIPNGAFASPDHGLSWTGGGAILDGVSLGGLAAAGNAVVGVGSAGAFRSTDGGAGWTKATGFPINGGPGLASFGGSLFAAVNKDVYRSVDSGATWAKFNGNLVNTGQYFSIAAITQIGNALVMAASNSGGLVRSLDGGNTWQIATGLSTTDFNYILSLAGSGNTVYAGALNTPRLFRSTDGGASFVPMAATGLSSRVLSLAVSGNSVLAGTNEGLFVSADSGGTFSPYDTRVPGFVQALAISGDRLYAGTSKSGVWVLPAPGKISRFVPVVLDVISGTAHFTTELSLTNRGTSNAAVTILYTASQGSGTGTVGDTLAAGRQLVIPDVIAYLRQKGLAIPATGSQIGTLLLSFDGVSAQDVVAGVARTTSATQAPQPAGSAGLAYAAVEPVADASTDTLWVYGLRQNATDRSNLAVYNPTPDPVTVKVTAYSGDGQTSVIAASEVLPGYGWKQYNGIMNGVGNGSGYVQVVRVSSSGAFGVYGVINDQATNDGSFVLPVSGGSLESYMDVPVLVETSAFVTELVLANRRSVATTFQIVYTESLSSAGGSGGAASVTLQPGEQRIIPGAIDFLRNNGATLGPSGPAFAGSLSVFVPGPLVSDVFVGARTASPSSAGGQFGLFYAANTPGTEALTQAFLYGLRADANNRSNVAVLNTAPAGSDFVTLSLQAYDGDAGGAETGAAETITLLPSQWHQFGNFLAGKGVANGWVKITRTAGTAPWVAYGVINDGGAPGQRTGDGAYVPMAK